MADFCNECSKEMGFDFIDIDIYDIYDELQLDMYQPCLCEGCGLKAIAKDEKGNMLLAGLNSNNLWVSKEEYFNKTKGEI